MNGLTKRDTLLGEGVLGALHAVVEFGKCRCDKSMVGGVLQQVGNGIGVETTVQTMRVRGEIQSGPNVDYDVLEGACRHTSTASLPFHVRPADTDRLLFNERTVATEAGLRIVDKPFFHFDTRFCVDAPVPVRESAIVTALLAQSFLVEMNVVAVPC